jgi:hypothetical protein
MNDDDQDAIIRIIEEQDPDVELGAGKSLLDATGLGLAAIYALREYMEGALEKRGQKYPEQRGCTLPSVMGQRPPGIGPRMARRRFPFCED